MYTTTPTPRLIAKEKGLTRYMSEPCIYGHVSERFVRNNTCVKCEKIRSKILQKRRSAELRAGRPPKPPYIPKTNFEKWIQRNKTNRKAKTSREALSAEYYKTLYVTHCPLLGLELSYDTYIGGVPKNYASLDKIDPQKGYVEGNVQIISFRANTLKNSATLEEMRMLVDNWEKMYIHLPQSAAT